MSLSRASTPALAALALLSITLYAFAERSRTPVHVDAYRMKIEATRLMMKSEKVIREEKIRRGIAIDPRNDPSQSGLIGPQFTLITTDRGSQSAKTLAAHPNFAAAVTQMMLEAGVRKGDLVAVGMTGSLPGLNLAVLCASKVIDCHAIVITSTGASMFGATDPEFTWLEMEHLLVEGGLLPNPSFAASVGGGGDVGRGLSPSGRDLLTAAIRRNGVRLLEPTTLLEAVRQRVAIYDSIATSGRQPIRLYINVGGGVASLGGAQNGNLIPAGLTRRLAARNYPNRGVINVLAERRIPVIHLLQVEKLARQLGIVDDKGETVKPGEGMLFIHYRYKVWLVAVAAVVLLFAHVFVLRHDIRQQMLGRPHPEARTTT